MDNLNKIRNFCIIAHVDHGKSTISDKIIQKCTNLNTKDIKSQMLDSLETERARGITIKSQTVCLEYITSQNNYKLNLIDTPGHVDFSYEVSRSLASCEGALLVVDASSGIQAQTLANFRIAQKQELTIIPVINKIDLPGANPEKIKENMRSILNIETDQTIFCSAKLNIGIDKILESVVKKIPSPTGDISNNLQARIIDAWFDNYMGVIFLVRVYNGILNKKDTIKIVGNNSIHKVESVGIFNPKAKEQNSLQAGSVGYVITGIRDISLVLVGDTICHADKPCEPMQGFKKSTPMMYADLFPDSQEDANKMQACLHKLGMNDSSFTYEHEYTEALGHGFKCGFLGMLHMEVIKDRLKSEYELQVINTSPSVNYMAIDDRQNQTLVKCPKDMPKKTKYIKEPVAKVHFVVPERCIGDIIQLCQNKRGNQIEFNYLGSEIEMIYVLPMIEVINNLSYKIKSITNGFGSFSYEFLEYREADMQILDIKINDETYDAFSQIVHKDNIRKIGKSFIEKLAAKMNREQFEIKIQACIGSKVVARETIKPFRKDVTAKCYGGDITRRKKLLKKQKEGKKKMRKSGRIKALSKVAYEIMKD